jgi:putative PIN family toxin of toxin-antitoxin system
VTVLIVSNEMLAEVTKALRYPRFVALCGLKDEDLLEYAQFLRSVAAVVALDAHYRAPIRDPYDLIVLQTAEVGDANILCSSDNDFFDSVVLAYCAARGIEVCDEGTLLNRLQWRVSPQRMYCCRQPWVLFTPIISQL